MDFLDEDFLCPISMEIMEEPVTICTGVTYERKNIQKWFKKYKKNTCPATMQCIDHNFDMTPNHTLKRLIQAWKNGKSQATTSSSINISSKSNKHDDLVSILESIESTPFKVTSLKKLRSMIEVSDDKKKIDLVKLGGVEVLVKIIVQILVESSDFAAFRACEEALVVLHQLFLVCVDDNGHHQTLALLVTKPECMKSCALMLQRGSTQARFCAVSLLQKMVKDSSSNIIEEEGIGFFKSLLEIVSDELYTKSSYCALQVLIEILNVSKKSRLKTIEAGGVCILIELLPDSSSKSKCERIMELIKMICECDEGRVAFQEHGLGIAAISKKILNVSNTCTKIGVKILWLISCNICHQSARESVLEEMLSFGGVSKLVTILHFSSQSSTKDRALKLLKLHANYWKTNPCFPKEIDDCTVATSHLYYLT